MSKVGIAENMRGMLHKWTTWDKYFKYLKFSATLERFSLFLECFGEIYFLYEPSEVLLEYLRSDVPVFVSVSSKTAPSPVMCVTSVWTNSWRGDILVEKIQDMMGAASASIYPINLL